LTHGDDDQHTVGDLPPPTPSPTLASARFGSQISDNRSEASLCKSQSPTSPFLVSRSSRYFWPASIPISPLVLLLWSSLSFSPVLLRGDSVRSRRDPINGLCGIIFMIHCGIYDHVARRTRELQPQKGG
jgi:hypothetical protein